MLDSKEAVLPASMDVGNILRVIGILVLIIVAAYFLTKYIAKRSLRQGMRDQPRQRSASSQQRQKPEFGHMVAVVDRITVDRDKTLMVVEFEGRHYLIGTTADGFQCIDHVDMPPQEEAAPEPEAMTAEPVDERPPDERTFGQRFRKAFGIVLQSYLPKKMVSKTNAGKKTPFDEQLKARIRAKTESGSDAADSSD